MDRSMIAYCGSYCGACEWKDKIGYNGCKASSGNMFWGECKKAKCCISKEYEHCGECADLPCTELKLLFGDPDHGDKGVRICNLLNWKDGNFVYEKLGNTAQEQAKGYNQSVGPEMIAVKMYIKDPHSVGIMPNMIVLQECINEI